MDFVVIRVYLLWISYVVACLPLGLGTLGVDDAARAVE